MEWNIQNGDYVPNGAGSMEALKGAEAVLARVRFRLTARRGALPFLPKLGSRLHQVLRERPSARQALCAQYVAEALEEESDLKITEVILEEQGETVRLTVWLEWQGETLSAELELG